MKQQSGPVPTLAIGAIVVAALATVAIEGGWAFWIPLVLVGIVAARYWAATTR